MKEYLISVIGAVLICALLTSIIPNGKNASLLRGMAKVLCLSVIVSPILFYFKHNSNIGGEIYKDFFSDSVIQTDQGFINYYSESRVSYTETKIEQEILEKFQIAVSVSMDWEYRQSNGDDKSADFTIQIKQIRLKLAERINEEEQSAMCEFLTENYCSEVLIE